MAPITWPGVAAECGALALPTAARLPETIVPAEQVESRPMPTGAAMSALAQGTELGIGAGRIVLSTARRVAHAAQSLVSEAPAQLPRLARIEQLDPSTRISLGQLLEEQARKTPNEICFLFGDRAIRQSEVKYRVDSVVKGLISIGIRHGDRVGVLMDTRPSAFTLIAALSRLGATAVLLRPDGEIDREARLGRVTWVISDPEHAERVSDLPEVRWCVLGVGTDGARELPEGVLDMERIDPAEVEVPAWYSPNPHRAGDVAYVLFTGEGTTTKATQITNRRWALSALGTAAAAALKPGDTVYSVTPIHHSSALLMSVGGAVASGARFAMSSNPDPETFWTEVRRYGVSHVSYTWTSLHDITYGPVNPNEAYNPIRMFIGSGMPRNLWTRVSRAVPQRPHPRVLRLGGGRGDPGEPDRAEAGIDGQTAPGRGRGAGSCVQPDHPPARAHQQRPRPRGARRRGRPAAHPGQRQRDARHSAAQRVPAGGRLAVVQRPVPARRSG